MFKRLKSQTFYSNKLEKKILLVCILNLNQFPITFDYIHSLFNGFGPVNKVINYINSNFLFKINT